MNPTNKTLVLALTLLTPMYARAVEISLHTYNPVITTTKVSSNPIKDLNHPDYLEGFVASSGDRTCALVGGRGMYYPSLGGGMQDLKVRKERENIIYDAPAGMAGTYQIEVDAICRGPMSAVRPTVTIAPYGGTDLNPGWTVTRPIETLPAVTYTVRIPDVPELRLRPNECSTSSVMMTGDLSYINVVASDVQVRHPLTSLRVTPNGGNLELHACAGGRGGHGTSSFVVRASLK